MTASTQILASPPIVETPTGGREQHWPLPTDEARLLELLHVLFDENWNEIWFGIIMEGAAWEVAAPNAPERISMLDGYATVDFGRWHFHLCIGAHTASGPELGKVRQCARALMYRSLGKDGAPVSWGLRLFNGRDEQMMTVMLPNPYLSRTQKLEEAPTWERLELWDRLREQFLRLGSDELDRTGKGFGKR